MSDHDASYAGKLIELMGRATPSCRTFVDVGAHRGDFSLMLRRSFPESSIYAIEADADLCEGMKAMFAGDANVDVSNWALHEKPGDLEFYVHIDRGTSSVLQRSNGSRRYFHSSDRVVDVRKVPAISLDQFIGAKGIDRVDLLKLDTQGAEAAILRGAQNSLSGALIDVIYTEFFVVPHYEGAALLHDLWKQLADYGYGLYDLFKGPCGLNGQLRFGDAIFVSPHFSEKYLGNSVHEP